MDDKIFIGLSIYIIISVFVIGAIDTQFISGEIISTNKVTDQYTGFQSAINQSGDLSSVNSQKNFIIRGLQFTFFTWTIEHIPLIVSLGIFIINWLVVSLMSIYIYDKIRGIG
jgi:hypothetical protein